MRGSGSTNYGTSTTARRSTAMEKDTVCRLAIAGDSRTQQINAMPRDLTANSTTVQGERGGPGAPRRQPTAPHAAAGTDRTRHTGAGTPEAAPGGRRGATETPGGAGRGAESGEP